MLSDWIINLNTKGAYNRQKIGLLSGWVGIFVNLILFISKLTIGLILNSISILADAFNNFSDLGSCLVTIIGFKIADKPADKDHPFGHGRGEYIAGLVVSFMVVLVGFEFTKSSLSRIINPTMINFSLISFLILIFSIIAKFWLGNFNKKLSKIISSGTLSASSFDSYADVITTSCVALSLLLSKFTSVPVDGYIGLLVSLFVIYEGYSLIKETINPLLGEAPDPFLVKSIIHEVMSYKNIVGVHDLVIHSYGAGKYMASIHAEIPSNIPVMESHEIIDKAEIEISKKLNINLVIHMDPLNLDNDEINKTRIKLEQIIFSFPEIVSIHDFRIVGKEPDKNILFDIVISSSISDSRATEIINNVKDMAKNKYPEYNLVINYDIDYTQQY